MVGIGYQVIGVGEGDNQLKARFTFGGEAEVGGQRGALEFAEAQEGDARGGLCGRLE